MRAFVPMAAAILLSIAGPMSAASPSVSFYGVALGEPLALEECPPAEAGAASRMCYRKSSDFLPPTDASKMRNIAIIFPAGQVPAPIKGDMFYGLVANGRVEELFVFTRGVSVQPEMIDQLLQKFGAPDSRDIKAVQNGFGAKFEVASLIWVRGGMTIHFEGASGELTSGSLYASSPAALKYHSDKLQERKTSSPKL
jgi:hypothetical protein